MWCGGETETARAQGADTQTLLWEVTASNGQVVERYVQLDISKAYTPIIPAAFTGTDANGVMTLHGIAGIRFQ